MRRYVLQVAILFFSILISWKGIAQCPTGSITITSQEDLDYYATTFPNCTEWPYGIAIFQPVGEDYTSLDFFGNLTSIGGTLTVRGNADYLSAFSNLQSLESSLNIEEIEGGVVEIPNSITNLGGWLRLIECQDISVTGMEGIQTMDESFWIDECINISFSALQNLTAMKRIIVESSSQIDLSGGLQSLQTIEKLSISNMQSSGTLTFPNSITSIEGDVSGNAIAITGCSNYAITGLEGVTSMEGRIEIESSSDLEFNALPNLETLGWLWITNCTGIIELFGLESLQVIEHSFRIQDSPSTTLEVSGFDCESYIDEVNIDSNAGQLFMSWSDFPEEVGDVFVTESNLTSLSLFSDIEQIHGSLKVDGVPELIDVSGLSSLTSIGSDFWLIDAPVLSSTNGLAAIQEIGGSFRFIEVGQELDFAPINGDGFTSLISIGGDVDISDMPYFGNWKTIGFPQLQSVGGWFTINNVGMSSIELMSELNYVGGELSISDCPFLSQCEIEYICNGVSCAGAGCVHLINNDFGCSYTEEVECPDLPQVFGKVFADIDCEGNQDAEEPGIPIHMILGNGNLLGFTNSAGEYSVDLDINEDYELSVAPLTGFDNNTTQIISSPSESESFYFEFPMCPLGDDVSNLSVSVTPVLNPMPGFTNEYEVCVANLGTENTVGLLSFEIPGFNSATISDAEGGVIDGNMVSWTTGDIEPFETECFSVMVEIDPGTLGQIFNCVASVEMQGATDDDLSNNTHALQQTIVGSYDPNDKLVNYDIIDVSNYENDSLFTLEYLIRFQNTGSAPATFVRVTDYLPPELDPTTVEMIHASHDYELSYISEQTGFVETPPKFEWFFDDINLPDSTINEPESHGFIHFRISTYPDISPGDEIENFASIYFDFNIAVITEDAITRFVECDEESLAITGPEEVCAGDTTWLTATLPGFDTYTWTVEGEQIAGGQQLQTAFYETGNVDLTISNQTCTLATSLQVQVNEQPDFTLQLGPYISCDSIIEIDISANGEVSWHLGDSLVATEDPTVLSQSGTYMVTNENDCGAIQSGVDVFVHQLELEHPTTICENDLISLEPVFDGYDTFEWQIEGEMYSGDSLQVPFSGDGSVELVASSDYCSDTLAWNFELLEQPAMNIILEPWVGCHGEVEIDLNPIGDVNWYLNEEPIASGNPVTLYDSGLYNVTVENECGMIENDVAVEVYDIPDEVTLTFNGEQLIVSPEGSGYVWLLEGLPVSTEGPEFTPTESGEYTVIVYFEGSMCNQSSNAVLVPVYISESLAAKIQLFPNPARNLSTLTLRQGLWQVSLLDARGKIIQGFENVTSSQLEIDLNNLSRGVYFVNVQSNAGKVVKKLVVE